MTDFKWRGKCSRCRKQRFFIRKATILIPQLKQEATSRDLYCGPCIRIIRKGL